MKINIKLPLINLAMNNKQIKNSLDYKLIDEMLDELKWWREQKLIRPEDVMGYAYYHMDDIALSGLKNAIDEIPIVEYRGKDNDN